MDKRDLLVIDNVLIPDMERDRLKIYEKDLDVELRMMSGRMVIEERGKIWVIEASFSEIDAGLLKELTDAMAGTQVHTIAFLPPTGGADLRSGRFILTKRPQPALKSWMAELPEWSGLEYTFEEEIPH